MSARQLGALVLLGALWGVSYMFIRVAVPELGPFVLMGCRVALAVLALTLYAAAVRQLPKFRGRLRQFLILGTVNSAIPFSLIAAAEIEIPASLAAILNSTSALFVAGVAAVWIGESLTVRKVAGLLLGVAGVGVLVGFPSVPLTGPVLLAVGAMLGASLSYAVGGVYAKRAFEGVPGLTMAIGQMSGAAVTLVPLAAVTVPDSAPSTAAVLSMLAIAVFSTAVAYFLYFYLIRTAGPTKTLTVTFLIPAFGLLSGVVFLNEPVGPGTIVGLGIILISVALVAEIRFGRKKVPA
ncbi:DMT family transporter [soil metagenome]|nr:DMT family transporter [Rubrobacter sp.]